MPVNDNAESLVQKAQRLGITPGAEPKKGFIQRTAVVASEEFQKGKESIGATAERFAQAPVAEKTLQAFKAPMQATGAGARILFSPITVAIGDAIESISNMPSAQRIAMSDKFSKILDVTGDAGVKLGEFAKDNPQFAGDIRDFVDTITLAIGPKAVKPVARATERVSEKISEALPREIPRPITTPRPVVPEVAPVFQRYGIEPPVSAVVESRAIKGTEAILQSAWLGGGKITKIVEEAQSGISKIAESLKKYADPQALVKPGTTLENVGNELKASLEKATDTFMRGQGKIFDTVEKAIGKQQAVSNESVKYLDRIISELKQSYVPASQKEAGFFSSILQGLGSAERRTFSNMKRTRTEIGKMLERAKRGMPIEAADVGRLKGLYSTLTKDIEATAIKYGGRNVADALKTANLQYREGITKINSIVGRTIKNARSPERIFGSLVKAGDVASVRQLRALVEPETFQSVADAFMNSVVVGSIVPITGKMNPAKLASMLAKYGDDFIREIAGERGLKQLKDLLRSSIADDVIEKGTLDGRVQPGRLAQVIEAYDEKVLRNVFSPEDFQKLMDLKAMAKAMGKAAKLVEGSPTAEKLQTGLNLVIGVGPGVGALATKLGIEWGMTKLFTTPWGRRLLTRGRLTGRGIGTAKGGQEVSKAVKEANVVPGAISGVSEGAKITRYAEQSAKTTEVSRETPKKADAGKAPTKPPAQFYGAAAGIQTDEEGKVKFNPTAAALGIAGMSFAKGNITTRLIKALKSTGKETLTLSEIKGVANKGGYSKADTNLILSTAERQGAKVSIAQLEKEIAPQLIPLKASAVPANQSALSRYGVGEDFVDNPAGYKEIVWESPIKTSAGDVHYSPGKFNASDEKAMSSNFPKYFSHTRFESLPNGDLKLIEVQSDLFQKGRLEEEVKPMNLFAQRTGAVDEDAQRRAWAMRGMIKKSYEKSGVIEKKRREISKLQPYDTAEGTASHLRTFREMVNYGIEKGNKRILIPTGETAMKIERLGETQIWRGVNTNRPTIKPEELKVGMEVYDRGGNSSIVTDILGDGKFKAVSKDRMEAYGYATLKDMRREYPIGEEDAPFSETFNISGKVDTSHFVYKLNETAMPKEALRMGLKVGEPVKVGQGKYRPVELPKEKPPMIAFSAGVIPIAAGQQKKE